ncbi:NAD(P)/FAD-dependent oxidoreductase [Luteolibacter algae]|uniref:NAD(P)/FAD-dependent oxidoreductase n=1 Tax=Luteolibacter algae TaxID=454151 RepID=A0ABW5D9J1_9BACT
MSPNGEPWLIIGQGLAGTCLAWEFLGRNEPFKIIDRGFGGSSRVAAGLLNPITGKNFEPSWRITDFYTESIDFYLRVERQLAHQLWYPLPILRLASSDKEWSKIAAKLELPQTARWIADTSPDHPDGFVAAVELTGGGRIDTANFIKLSATFFTERGLLEIGDHRGSPSGGRYILCEGASGLIENQIGQHRCAKGEILTVKSNWPETHIRIGSGGWLVPIGNNLFRVGSTYEWNHLTEYPTATGQERILNIARILGGSHFEIVDHVAGIRPILRRSQPLLGKNQNNDWIFNALGSKGTLYAPKFATMLADWILEGIEPNEDFILGSHFD